VRTFIISAAAPAAVAATFNWNLCLINNTLGVGRRRITTIMHKARRGKNIVKQETPADGWELRDLTLTEDRATSGSGDSLPSSSAAVVGLSIYYIILYEANVRRWSDYMSHASHQTSMRYNILVCAYKKRCLKRTHDIHYEYYYYYYYIILVYGSHDYRHHY